MDGKKGHNLSVERVHEAEHSNAERPEISEERKGKLGAGAVHINEAMMATAEPEVAEVSPAKQSIIEKLRARREVRAIEKRVNELEKLGATNTSRARLKIELGVKSGRYDLQNEQILDAYLGTIGDVSEDNLALITENGVEREKLIQNAHIQELTAQQLRDGIERANSRGRESWLPLGEMAESMGFSREVLSGILSDDTRREQLLGDVDMQRVGELLTNEFLLRADSGIFGPIPPEQMRRVQQDLSLLREMGFEPFKDGNVGKLFSTDIVPDRAIESTTRIQKRAAEVGLLDEGVVDRMYTYAENEMLADIMANSGEPVRKRLILAELEPSKNNLRARRVREKTQQMYELGLLPEVNNGAEAMCLELQSAQWAANRLRSHQGFVGAPDIPMEEAFARYYAGGRLQDAFFDVEQSSSSSPAKALLYSFHEHTYNADGSYAENVMAAMALNLDRVQGDMRGLVKTWAALSGDSSGDASAMRTALMRFATGDHNAYEFRLFDENGPTRDFYERSLRYPDLACEFLPALGAEASRHYSLAEQQYFDYAQKHSGGQGGKLARLVESYVHEGNNIQDVIDKFFDADGPTGLFGNALMVRDVDSLLRQPDLMMRMDGAYGHCARFLLACEEASKLQAREGYVAEECLDRSFIRAILGDTRGLGGLLEVEKYFDKDGATPMFAERLFESTHRYALASDDLTAMRGLLAEDKRKYLEFYRSCDAGKRELMRKMFSAGDYSSIYDENGFTDDAVRTAFLTHREALCQTPDLIERLPEDAQKFMKFYNDNPELAKALDSAFLNTSYGSFISMNDPLDFFDAEKGELTKAGYLKLLGAGTGYTKRIMERLDFTHMDERNIDYALARFMMCDAQDWTFANETDMLIRSAFMETETKDLAMRNLQHYYKEMLKHPSAKPMELATLCEIMHKNEGAGPLTQIESFLSFAGALAPHVGTLGDVTQRIEDRFTRDNWSDVDKSNFYSVAAEVINASPEIYKEFAELFDNIPSKDDFRTFVTEIFPLYRAKLTLLKGRGSANDNGLGLGYTFDDYSQIDKDGLMNQLHIALSPFNMQDLRQLSPEQWQQGIVHVHESIFGEIAELFERRFSIRSEVIPQHFDRQDARAVEDMTLYLSNMANPSAEKEAMVGFYLALQLDKDNHAWERFRSGEQIDPEKYLGREQAALVRRMMEISARNNPISAELTGISDAEQLTAFRQAVQTETENVRLGSIQTVDSRLQNLSGNLEELTDVDLYESQTDKEKIEILHRCLVTGNLDLIGVASSLLWSEASGKQPDKKTRQKVEMLSAEEHEAVAQVRQMMTDMMVGAGIEMTPANINTELQRGFSALKVPFSIVSDLRKAQVPEKIAGLRGCLTPPAEIASIFGRLGEEFRPQSGVLAIGADVDYLENLVVKREDEISPEEREQVNEYLSGIRARLTELQTIYDDSVRKFEKMKKSVAGDTKAGQDSHMALQEKIGEIDGIIYGASQQMPITTACATSLPTIIENMRACLSCKTKGCNNDTDLTFGEGYKFYLYSRNDGDNNGSVSDEIVHFVPVEESDGTKSLSFVMDQVYGRKSSDILLSHIGTMAKKASELRRQFPNVPFSIFVTDAALASCCTSVSAESLATDLAEFGIRRSNVVPVKDAKVVQPQSGYGDHYVEYGGSARKTGERDVGGFQIII